jgi:hypothetical protein
LNKMLKVFTIVFCLFAISTLGFVNAAPKPLKQVNMLYATTVDSGYPTAPTSTWLPVAGNQVSDFKLKLDGSAATWYFLNIKFLKASITIADDYYPFYLTASPDGYLAWVTTNAPAITDIANGDVPMFYLKVSNAGTSFMLVDGFQYYYSGGTEVNNVRLQGNYYLGTYTFTCNFGDLNEISMAIMFR